MLEGGYRHHHCCARHGCPRPCDSLVLLTL